VIDKVRKYIKQNKLFDKGAGIIIALSGGADSVCLFRILVSLREEYGLKLYAVHVNHGIRKGEAERDENFSRKLASEFNVPCSIYYYDIPALSSQWKMTEEEAGRKARYEAFENESAKTGADYIAVAHHANDQAETVLFRMCRGTGIKGICGIPAKRDNIIRPLLCAARNEIEEYLKKIGQDYMNDSTNEKCEYDRNRIRQNVIPQLREINSQAVEHICSMADSVSEVYNWFEQSCAVVYKECVEENAGSFYLNVEKATKYPEVVISQVIRTMISKLVTTLKDVERCHIEDIIGLFEAESGKSINLPYSMVAGKQYEYIRIYVAESDYTRNEDINYVLDVKAPEEKCTFYNVYIPERKKITDEFVVTFQLKKYNHNLDIIPKNSCVKWFDCDRINDTLKIRQSQNDDYFMIGDGKKKKMTRYMIDEKIPRQYRENLLVVADGNKVLYVIGGRMGKDCFVSEDTVNVLEIKYL